MIARRFLWPRALDASDARQFTAEVVIADALAVTRWHGRFGSAALLVPTGLNRRKEGVALWDGVTGPPPPDPVVLLVGDAPSPTCTSGRVIARLRPGVAIEITGEAVEVYDV